MKYDCIVVGAGIQGLLMLEQALARGLNACCVDKFPRIGNGQTLRSQFYIHRGHFYREPDLVSQLQFSYPLWQQLVRNLGVTVRASESYVGFVGDPEPWTSVWDDFEVPYAITHSRPSYLEGSRLAHAFEFPHMLFDGRELLAKLAQRNSHCFHFGTIAAIEQYDGGYRLRVDESTLETKKIILCAGAGTPDLVDMLPVSHTPVTVQTRTCQVMVMQGNAIASSIVVPDAQMFIAPQFDENGAPVLLYTYGTDPVQERDKESVDVGRLKAQADTLRRVLPGIDARAVHRKLYLAQKTESAALGEGRRPNCAFVEEIAEDVVCILPTKLSLALVAAEKALSLLDPSPTLSLSEPLVAHTPYFNQRASMEMLEVEHA